MVGSDGFRRQLCLCRRLCRAIFKQNASCRAVYQYAKEHLPQYSKVLLAMRWGSQMPENSHSLAYDADFFKKFDLMLQKTFFGKTSGLPDDRQS